MAQLPDEQVISVAREVVLSKDFAGLRRAHAATEEFEGSAAGIAFVYQPDLTPGVCGMTLFEEQGFVIGPSAFASEEEVLRTVLHEVFRLLTGQHGSGADRQAITVQSSDAYAFARQA